MFKFGSFYFHGNFILYGEIIFFMSNLGENCRQYKKQKAVQVERDVHKSSARRGTRDHPTREREARMGNCVGGLVASKL